MDKISKTPKLTNINIFGAPGVGKSTISAGLFYHMKIRGYKVEFITEYAKELTYDKSYIKLKDQLLVFANQFHRYYKLQNIGLDYLIHESPFVMGLSYINPDDIIPEEEFKTLVLSLFNRTDNINIYIERNEKNGYQEFGRNQNLEESKKLEKAILNILDSNNIPYIKLKSSKKTHKKILKIIKNHRKEIDENNKRK